MKKAFVSAQLAEKETVRDLYRELEERGIEITHDWTRTDNIDPDYTKNREEAGLRAKKDIDGVFDADLYIILTDNERCGKGMYVELGVALSEKKRDASRKIFLIGSMQHMSIFYFHPDVENFGDVESFLSYIDSEQS
jgi:hypothetical protein